MKQEKYQEIVFPLPEGEKYKFILERVFQMVNPSCEITIRYDGWSGGKIMCVLYEVLHHSKKKTK